MKPHCFEAGGHLCGVQSCDETEANIFINVEGVCQYARLLDKELHIPANFSLDLKGLFISNKHLFLSKIQELI